MEIQTLEDLKRNINNPVYVVIYSDELDEGILPFADNIATNKKFTPEDLFANIPIPSKMFFKVDQKYNKILNTYTSCWNIIPENDNWNNVHKLIQQECIKYSTVYVNVVYEGTVKTEQHQYKDRNIHMFESYDECQKYIDECNKKILNNLINFYNIKIAQYTTTVNKLHDFF